jgi:membrane-associated phospholipid phosphatase
VDASIEVLVPKTTLAAYPSEDGVVEGVTVEMLKLLFPTEGAYIREMAEEEKLCRIMSGANVRSDIEAGEALGRLVASKFAARAAADKAGAAIGTPTVWAQIESDCKARGETPWLSLDMPKRPPMLPLFGNVKSFLIDSLTQVANRPVPPPLTASAQFATELAEVKYYATHPTRENIRIVHFWADGTGTYTPPGHWNAIASEEFVQQNFSEVRWARNLALLNLSIMDAGIACWDAKYFYFNQRPSQADPSIKTLTGIPNFPAYVSGHSTFSAAAATYLGHVIPARADAFNAMAKEASDSRLFGAIHYRSDCAKGLELGTKVAASAIARARIDGAE